MNDGSWQSGHRAGAEALMSWVQPSAADFVIELSYGSE